MGDPNPIKPSRRAYLKTVASAGAFSVLAGRAFAKTENTVDLPFLMRGDKVVKRKSLPKQWWENYNRAKKAKETVTSMINEQQRQLNKDGKTNEYSGRTTVTGLEAGDVTYGGRPGFRVIARVKRPEVRDMLPDSQNGVKVRVEEASESGPNSCPGRGNFDPVPGGVAVYGNERGSSTTAVKENGNKRLMTAAHLWGDCSVQLGDTAYINGYYVNSIGDVSAIDRGRDFVLIDMSYGEDYENTIREESVDKEQVTGYVAESGVGSLITGGQKGYHVGSSTGWDDGYFKSMGLDAGNVDDSNCVDFGGEGVETTHGSAGGDSGAPVYIMQNGDAWMVNISTYGWGKDGPTPCSDDYVSKSAGGTAAYDIRDYWGLDWAI